MLKATTSGLTALLIGACAVTPPGEQIDVSDIATVFWGESSRQTISRSVWNPAVPATMGIVDCIALTPASTIGADLAPVLQFRLTHSELREARDFLSTAPGKSFRDRQLRKAPQPARLDLDDEDALIAFSNTTAGTKLMDISGLAKEMNVSTLAFVQACELKPGRLQAQMPTTRLTDSPCTRPQPTYPKASSRRGEKGQVVLRLWINEEGLVYQTVVTQSSGFPPLDLAADDAVRRIRCSPIMTDDGHPTKASAVQPITFNAY